MNNYYNKDAKNTVQGIKDLLGGKINHIEEEKSGIDIIVGKDFLNKDSE